MVVGGWWWVGGGGLFDFRVTPNPNFRLDVNLDVKFDKKKNKINNWQKQERGNYDFRSLQKLRECQL